MGRRFSWRRALTPLLLLGLAIAGRAGADTRVTVDFAQAHPFDGLGAEVDFNTRHRDLQLQLLRDLHARFVRLSVLPELEGELPTGLSVERYARLLPRLMHPKLAGRLAEFSSFLQSQQLRAQVVFWHMPEAWEQPIERPGVAPGRLHRAVDARLPDYARLLTAELLWVTGHGIEPEAVELTNEPQGAWDTRYTPAQYARLVAATRHELDLHGLARIRIAGPGTALRQAPDYLRALRDQGALDALGQVTAHVYDPPQVLAEAVPLGDAEFLGRGRIAPIAITEFGVKQHRADDVDAAAADLDVASHDYGLATGALALELLGRGASSLIYWELADVPGRSKRHGALDEDGHRRPVAHALQALFGQLPAPALTAPGTGGAPEVTVQGFIADGRVWLLLANLAGSPQRVSARLEGAAVRAVAGVQGYADGVLADAVMSDLAVEGVVFSGTIAPRALAAVALQ